MNICTFTQVLTSCSLLPSSSPLMSLLGEQQPESQLEEVKGLLLAVGGEEGLLALIDVANKKTVSNRCHQKKAKLTIYFIRSTKQSSTPLYWLSAH